MPTATNFEASGCLVASCQVAAGRGKGDVNKQETASEYSLATVAMTPVSFS